MVCRDCGNVVQFLACVVFIPQMPTFIMPTDIVWYSVCSMQQSQMCAPDANADGYLKRLNRHV
jgi:uncharacterized membrane protein (DUF106 family)